MNESQKLMHERDELRARQVRNLRYQRTNVGRRLCDTQIDAIQYTKRSAPIHKSLGITACEAATSKARRSSG